MAQTIEKDYSPVLGGDVAIMFNKGDGTFWVQYPDTVEHDLLISDKVDTLKQARTLRDDSIKAFTKSRFLARKVIAIRFMSSSIPEIERPKSQSLKDIHFGDTPNKLTGYGCVMGFDWAVFNEYNVDKRVVVKNEYVGIVNRQTTYKPVYGIRVEKYYELLYCSKYKKFGTVTNELRSERDTFFSWNPTHILTYTEDLETFCKNTEAAMESMVDRVTSFFHTDEMNFMENVNSNTKLLG